MANKTFQFVLMAPEKTLFEQPVTQAQLRGTAGELGILPGHVRLITPVKVSPLKLTLENGQEERFLIHSGTLDVSPERVRLLCSHVETPGEINVELARKTKEELENKLRGDVRPEEEPQLRSELALAQARLEIANRHGH
jgi:F-type H+-transporting ATPase subunit epsilon